MAWKITIVIWMDYRLDSSQDIHGHASNRVANVRWRAGHAGATYHAGGNPHRFDQEAVAVHARAFAAFMHALGKRP